MDDSELIRTYADTGSESAFTTLVQRHAGLVYSTALRQLADSHAAQDTSQAVFCLLADKAHTIEPKTSLTGWLYQTTCFKASEHRRTSQRRYTREQEAARMNSSINESNTDSDADWSRFAPMLDDAMQQLPDADRLAILLRYFQNQPLREVGVALGMEEDAAGKRVSRALDKLRDWFSAKGIVSTSIGLAGILSANAVQAVPIGITDALITGAVTAGSVTLSTSSFMASTKAVLATAAIVATALSVPLLSQRRENQNLQRQIQSRADELTRLKAQNVALSGAQISSDELARLRANLAELLRLRSEVGRLKRDLQARLTEPRASSSNATTVATDSNPDNLSVRLTGAVNARIPLGQTFLTGGWKTSLGKRVIAFITPSVGSEIGTRDQITFETVLLEATEDQLQRLSFDVEKQFGEIKSESVFNGSPAKDQLAMTKALLTKEQFAVVKTFFEQQAGTDVLTAPKMTTLNERQGQLISFGNDGTDPSPFAIDVMPRLTAGRDAVDLNVSVQFQQPAPTQKDLPTTSN